jgi:hypothetical protein
MGEDAVHSSAIDECQPLKLVDTHLSLSFLYCYKRCSRNTYGYCCFILRLSGFLSGGP